MGILFSLIYSSLLLGSSSQLQKDKSSIVNEDDLEILCKLVEDKDGGAPWIQMMDRSSPTMSYQAWRKDPEVSL